MTADQWRDELVRLVMEAYDAAPCSSLSFERDAFEERLRERMAQAAQRIEGESAAAYDRGVIDTDTASYTRGFEAGHAAGFAEGAAQSRWDVTP